jgi:4-hydroxy-tetrahydrodipicolinate synthase
MSGRSAQARGSLLSGGSFTALPTPFHAGNIDQDSLARLCERQIDRGTAALVVCGSTGEAASLRPEEHRLAIRVVVEAAAGRVPVMAGCGALSTDTAAELAIAAVHSGATALLCAPVPYVKPTQEGIIAHMRTIQGVAQLPLMIYDVPGRTGVTIANDTLGRLYEDGTIFGLKDATADLARPPRLRALCGGRFLQMSGDDGTAAAYRAAGGHGCISVTANVAPALCSLLHRSWDDGNLAAFADARDQLAALSDLLFVESNPIPLKAALSIMGLIEAELRLPLTAPSRDTIERLVEPLSAILATEEALVTEGALAARMRYRLAS